MLENSIVTRNSCGLGEVGAGVVTVVFTLFVVLLVVIDVFVDVVLALGAVVLIVVVVVVVVVVLVVFVLTVVVPLEGFVTLCVVLPLNISASGFISS